MKIRRLVVVLLILTGGGAAAVELPEMAGRPLVDVLEQLRDLGVQVIYSDELVTPEMKVGDGPTSSEPEAVLRELLAEHGLGVKNGPEDTLIVVKAAPQPTGRVSGVVRSKDEGRGIEGATVRLDPGAMTAVSGPGGRFDLDRVPAGKISVDVSRPGFLPVRRDRLEVVEGLTTTIDIELALEPVFGAEVVVAPSRYTIMERELETRHFLDREQVDSLPHFADDLFRVMSLLPGSSQADFVSEFRLRGGDHNETLLLLDGIPLYQPYHFKQILGVLSTIDAEAVDGMSVHLGGFGAEFGDRMGGVVEVRPSTAREQRRTNIGLSFVTARVITEGLIGDGRGSYLVAARRGYLDLLLDGFAETTPGFQDGPTYYDLLATLSWQIGDSSIFKGGIFGSSDGILYKSEADDDTAFDASADSLYGWLSLETEWDPGLWSKTAVWANQVESRIEGHKQDPGSSFIRVDDDRHLEVIGLKSDWSWQFLENHTMQWGVDLRDIRSDYDYHSRGMVDNPAIVGDGPPVFTQIDSDLQVGGLFSGVYIADRFRLTSRFIAELGVRWDRQEWTPSSDQLSPRLNFAWDLGKAGTLRFAWGRYAQSHSPDEVMVEDGRFDIFSAQWAEHRVATWQWPFAGGHHLRFEAYHKRYEDLRPRFENLYEPYELFNQGLYDRVRIDPEAAEAWGFEVLVRSDPTRRWSWWASYVRSSVEDLEDGRWAPRYWDQPHAISCSVNWRPGRSWNVNLTGLYHTGWPSTPQTATLRQRDDGSWWVQWELEDRNSMRVPDYLRFDLRASRVFRLRRSELSVFFEVMNLVDRVNPRYPLFSTNVTELVEGPLKVTTEYSETWMGFAPTFGITWTF